MIPVANAPKKQPCPNCHTWVKRYRRSEHTASYFCTKCNLENRMSIRPSRRNLAILAALQRRRIEKRAAAWGKEHQGVHKPKVRPLPWWKRLYALFGKFFVNSKLTQHQQYAAGGKNG